ncbi:hypothetical protein RP726_15805 [Candidatus Methylospira mobilis]|nr:hypothetical protein [Candidatus Methylospira mobilis]WNV03882.1 hypothetical protein RP726_15805 [Candidatus Methylospira mobilis]
MAKSEAQTRVELIEKLLEKSGWNVKDPTQVAEEYDIQIPLPDGISEPRTAYEGHLFSDYVLLGKNGKPLAVIEAKKSSKDAAIGREQAKQYCFNIHRRCKAVGSSVPSQTSRAARRSVTGFPEREGAG